MVLIDGYGFVFRAYHSLPPLTTSKGIPIGAVLGFTNMLIKLLPTIEADYVAVILDAGEKTFRNDLYTDYKANRPPAPEDLKPQFPLIRQAAEALNIAVLDKKGFEADDLIATYIHQAKSAGMTATVISSDKDLMQLVDEDVSLYDAMKNKPIGIEQVQEKFGVTPDKLLDVLSLMGDSSDNVPGVAGIGPKTAAQLIEEYGTLENLLTHADQIKQNKRRETLLNSKDIALLSKQLITLDAAVPDLPPLEQLTVQSLDPAKLVPFLQEYEFKSTLARIQEQYGLEAVDLGKDNTSEHAQPSFTLPDIAVIHSKEALHHSIQQLQSEKQLAIELVTDQEKICAVGIGSDSRICVIPLSHPATTTQTSLLDADESQPTQGLTDKESLSLLAALWNNPAIKIIGHDIKQLLHQLQAYDQTLAVYDDIMVMSYVLDASLHDHHLNSIASHHNLLTKGALELEELLGKGKQTQSVRDIEQQKLTEYLGQRVGLIFHLQQQLKQRLFTEKLTTIYERMDRPLVRLLWQMEHVGVRIDPLLLQSLSEEFQQRLSVLEKEVHQLAGKEFNLASPKQLGEILFDDMNCTVEGKPPQKTKTGAYVTNAETLEKLALEGYDIAEKIILWRGLAKLKSTYTDTLVKQISPKDQRIHTNFTMTITSTGRLSSTNPNVQNIPVRTEEGYKIREAFIPKEGHQLISADYSQIELRLLAHIADITALQEAFAANKDIHAITASQIFGIPLDQMDAMTRRKAKAINFGIIYGISPFGLARQLSISRKQAADYIAAYFEQYPGIRHYMERIKQFARQHGYVETLFKRRCYTKDINSKNAMLRNFSERAAINAPLQGSASDIIKYAMLKLQQRLERESVSASMILQVHDELLLEVKDSQTEQVAALIRHEMVHASPIDLALKVEVGIGNNWRLIH